MRGGAFIEGRGGAWFAPLAAQPGVLPVAPRQEGDLPPHLGVVHPPARLVRQALPPPARLLVVPPPPHRLRQPVLREDPVGGVGKNRVRPTHTPSPLLSANEPTAGRNPGDLGKIGTRFCIFNSPFYCFLVLGWGPPPFYSEGESRSLSTAFFFFFQSCGRLRIMRRGMSTLGASLSR